MAYGTEGSTNTELDAILQMANAAEKMDEEERQKLGELVVTGYEADLASRADWEKRYAESMELAMQVRSQKTFPWVGASNVKYPLLSTAAMQFAARAYPALIPASGIVVNYRVIGEDKDGAKAARAKRVSQFMSWQVLEDMPDWEEEMDRMLITLPVVGTCFKKTYFDSKLGKKCSHMVSATDLVVNYWATSLEECERKTEKMYLTHRQLTEKMRSGEYLEIDLPDPNTELLKRTDKISGLNAGDADEATPYLVLEQHRFYDLDGDGYKEPYVVTVLAQDHSLLRVCARWASDGVKRDEKNKIICVYPSEYYTKYGFIPNPDGGFYDVGFGSLLGPLNESVNTIINQLVDAGTLANLQGGWISKGLRIKQGKQGFTPGEWKQVEANLDDIKKGIFPMPVKEPSNVLFQLLGMLVTSTKELASVAEIFTGKMPGQNTPAYTTKETVEQGMKVFTAIYKRLYRALSHEFKKIYVLNQLYFDGEAVIRVTDNQASSEDFTGPADDIVPAADPQAASSADKVAKSEKLAQMLQLGLRKEAVVARMLEALEVPNSAELLPDPNQPPPPPPEIQKLQMEAKMKQEELQAKMQADQQQLQAKMQAEKESMQAEMQMDQQRFQLEIEKMRNDMQHEEQLFQLKLKEAQLKLQVAQAQLGMKREEMKLDMQATMMGAQVDQKAAELQMNQTEQMHAQKLEQGQAAHDQKMKQAKENKANAGTDNQNGRKGVVAKPGNTSSS